MYYIQRYKISCDQQNAYTIDLFNTSIPPNPLYAPLRGIPPSFPLYPPLMAAKLLQYYVFKKTRHERSKLIVKNGESSNIIL